MTFRNKNSRNITIGGIIAVIAIASILSLSNASTSSAQTPIATAQDLTPIARSPAPFVYELPKGAIDGVTYQGVALASPLAEIQRSTSRSLPIMLHSTTDKPITITFHTTFGSDQRGLAKMPSGVSVTVEPQQITLLPNQDVVVNLNVSVDRNATDGTYHQELVGKWDDLNGFMGTSVVLKIGNGSSKILYPEDIGK